MCRKSAAISSRSRVTKCAGRRASALFTAARRFSNHAALARRRGNDRQRRFRKKHVQNAPQRFEAGTPNIAGAIGLAAALITSSDRAHGDFRARLGAGRMPRTARRNSRPAHPRADRRTRRARRLRHGMRASARSHHLRRPIRAGLARRAPLQSAADAQTRRDRHHAREFLFL